MSDPRHRLIDQSSPDVAPVVVESVYGTLRGDGVARVDQDLRRRPTMNVGPEGLCQPSAA